MHEKNIYFYKLKNKNYITIKIYNKSDLKFYIII